MRVPPIDPQSFFSGKAPEPIVVVHTENGPKMMTLEEVRKHMGGDDPNNKLPKFLEWLKKFLSRFF